MKPRRPRHITVSRSGRAWPERYFSGLSRSLKLEREKELLKRRRLPYSKLRLGKSNIGGTRKKSKWTQLFHKVYPGLKFNKEAIARRTGISRSTLNTVYNRGLKAWKTGGSRPGATAPQWAVARVYKYVLITKGKAPKAWYVTRYDPDANLRARR
jgi:Family of unknown function (DUF5824)